ncbi:MAG: SDR family oxidoreductase [Acidobacteria bacterium]|nr:SDR family oxidoreductase [Acidobacteriota bacterium]
MSLFLEGKTAIVTGGTRGIGFETARELLAHGARVVICGRSESSVAAALARLSPADRVAGCAADVSDPVQVERLFQLGAERFGAIHILVNNAGVGWSASVGSMTLDDWKRVLDVNLTGSFLCSGQAVRHFLKTGGGHIINISSLAGKNVFAGGAVYNASKFGLNALGEATMLDHRHEGVRVTNILPGSVDTEFSLRSRTDNRTEAGAAVSPKSDWKIAPEDVARVVLDVLSMPSRTLISSIEMRPSMPPRR